MGGSKARPLRERFEEKFMPEPNSGCWLWIASCLPWGYGTIKVGSRTDGSRITARAHCLSWALYRGPIPKGLNVLHKCDTPYCVNPDHLYVGTQKHNVRDMYQRRGDQNGERNRNSKLTNKEVLAIRAASGSLKEIADRFGVSFPLISMIRHRKIWKHI
jgi:hypothetical protein